MSNVKIGSHREIRLPEEAVRALKLRKGTRLDVRVTGDAVVLVPSARIPKDQQYFWTDEWQKKEREADEAITRGDILGPFADADKAIRKLRTAKV